MATCPTGALVGLLGNKFGVLLLEGIGDVLEEDQAQDDMLVLGGVHAAAQRVGYLLEQGFVTDGGAIVGRGGGVLFWLGQGVPGNRLLRDGVRCGWRPAFWQRYIFPQALLVWQVAAPFRIDPENMPTLFAFAAWI